MFAASDQRDPLLSGSESKFVVIQPRAMNVPRRENYREIALKTKASFWCVVQIYGVTQYDRLETSKP